MLLPLMMFSLYQSLRLEAPRKQCLPIMGLWRLQWGISLGCQGWERWSQHMSPQMGGMVWLGAVRKTDLLQTLQHSQALV